MSDDKSEADDGRQCGPNLTGHVYRCACCLNTCPPLAPDNCTMIPVCVSCWKQISPSNKLMIVTFTRNTKALSELTEAIQQYLSQRNVVVGKFRPGESN
jgi:hypothetical protein